MPSSALRVAVPAMILVLLAGCATRQHHETLSAGSPVASHGVQPLSSDPELEAFLERHAEAHTRFLNGDVSMWNELASLSADATLFPPFGGVARGGEEVVARYAAAATRLTPSTASVDMEVHAAGVSGDLAYVVRFERVRVQMQGSDELTSAFVRVTHILRRENGQWRLLHRHMDHLPEIYMVPDP